MCTEISIGLWERPAHFFKAKFIMKRKTYIRERQHVLLLKDHVIAWLARLGEQGLQALCHVIQVC